MDLPIRAISPQDESTRPFEHFGPADLRSMPKQAFDTQPLEAF